MDLYIDRIVQIHEARQQIHWSEGEMDRFYRLGSRSDYARHVYPARQLAVASNQLCEYENKLEYLVTNVFDGRSREQLMEVYGDQLARAKKAKKRAENKKNSAQKRETHAIKEK